MPTRTLDVVCLCAAWCRLCDAYRATFDRLATETVMPGVALRWHWVDIEDHDDALGDLDIQTFPTVMLVDGAALLYAGPVLPQADPLLRLLKAAATDGRVGPPAPDADAYAAAAARLLPASTVQK